MQQFCVCVVGVLETIDFGEIISTGFGYDKDGICTILFPLSHKSFNFYF